MAIDFAGMFADPNSFRDQRLQDLMQQRAGISQMGGSMNQLLGQVAAGGGATGAQLAEGIGGMFGLQTREEAQAKQLQDMASQVSMEDPVALGAFAKRLNDMGMTKQAVQVMEKRQSVIDQLNADEDRKRKNALPERRTYNQIIYKPMQTGSGKNAKIVQVPMEVTVTEEGIYNPQTGKWDWRVIGQSPVNGSGATGFISSPSGNVRAPEGTKVVRPAPTPDPKQVEETLKPLDPWDEFTRYGGGL